VGRAGIGLIEAPARLRRLAAVPADRGGSDLVATEVCTFDPAVAPVGAEGGPDRPRLLWAAPGSIAVDEVAAAWARRAHLADLGQVGGPWGVVLWDPSARAHVVAVDPVGVQPLFWARTADGRVAVASWLAQLVDRPDVDDALDPEGILLDEGQGIFGEPVLHRTRFRAVQRIPWGRALVVRPDGATSLRQHWDPRARSGPDPTLSPEDCAELLAERVDAAIRRLLPADDAAVGAHVSGGLDCTAVACRANQLLRHEGRRGLVAGYSWAPHPDEVPRFAGDERSLLDAVAAAEGIEVRTVRLDGSGDWFLGLDHDRYAQSTHVYERFVLPQARADGVQVLLSGWGGDELASFNGRAVTRSLVRRGRLDLVWRHATRRASVAAGGRVGLARTARSFARAVQPELPKRLARRMDRPELRAVDAEAATLADELDGALRAWSPLAADVRRDRAEAFLAAGDHHAYQLLLLTGGHLQRRTGWWYQTGRLFDVSYRYPLLDLGVVTAALRLPWWAYRSEGWNRLAFRRAVAPWLPPDVAWNPTKHEPALHSPPTPRARTRTTPPPAAAPRPVESEDLRTARELVDRTYRRGGRRTDPDARVVPRPEVAPR
jgi:asparagine synthase (glutamine-hydrolysing)